MAAEAEGSDCSAQDGQVGAGGHDAVNAELSRLAAPHVAEFLPGVKLLQVPEPEHVGQEVWSSGQVFAAFASSCFEAGYWKDKRVLEVGAGLGGVSLALAGLGATVLATDAAEPASVLEGLRRNVEREQRVMVRPLSWLREAAHVPDTSPCEPCPEVVLQDIGGSVHHIVMCDVLYDSRDTAAVLCTAAALMSASARAGQEPSTFLAVEVRSSNRCLATQLEAAGLQGTVLPLPPAKVLSELPGSAAPTLVQHVGLVLLQLRPEPGAVESGC